MIRIYDKFAGRILSALVYARGQLGDRLDVADDTNLRTAYGRGISCYNQTVAEILEDDRAGGVDYEANPTVTSLIDPLAQQVYDERWKTPHDKDLIDTVVRLLQLSFLKNRLTLENLKRLRAAILLPSELVGLKEKLKASEMFCGQCYHKFRSGEMASVLREQDSVYLLCTTCFKPESLACVGKNRHSLDVDKALHKAVAKCAENCPYCKEEKDGAEIGAIIPMDGQAPAGRLEYNVMAGGHGGGGGRIARDRNLDTARVAWAAGANQVLPPTPQTVPTLTEADNNPWEIARQQFQEHFIAMPTAPPQAPPQGVRMVDYDEEEDVDRDERF